MINMTKSLKNRLQAIEEYAKVCISSKVDLGPNNYIIIEDLKNKIKFNNRAVLLHRLLRFTTRELYETAITSFNPESKKSTSDKFTIDFNRLSTSSIQSIISYIQKHGSNSVISKLHEVITLLEKREEEHVNSKRRPKAISTFQYSEDSTTIRLAGWRARQLRNETASINPLDRALFDYHSLTHALYGVNTLQGTQR